MKKARIPVAQEGYPFIALAGFATLVAAVLEHDLLSCLLLALTAFILYFFRDPARIVPEQDDALVSPADGRVILVEKVYDDTFLNEHACKVSIFMNIFDVHVNRAPFSGRVTSIRYRPGKFYAADSERGALENETCALLLDGGEGRTLACVQMAGLIARRIVCWAERGDALRKGQRFGLIRFGSRVDIYLPLQVQLEVSVGRRVKAGETILGYFPSV